MLFAVLVGYIEIQSRGAPMLYRVAVTQLAMFSADTLTAPAGPQQQTEYVAATLLCKC